MKKILPFIYLGTISCGLLIDYYQAYNYRNILSGLLIFLLIVYYTLNRKSKFVENDWIFIEVLIIFFLAEVLTALFSDFPINVKVVVSSICFFIAQNRLIKLFRNEGATIPTSLLKKDRSIWLITMIVLVIYLLFLPKVTDFMLIPTLVFLVQLTFLHWMAAKRPVNEKSNALSRYGILIFLVAQFSEFLNSFIFHFPLRALLYLSLFGVAHFSITKGVLLNANETNLD